MKEAGKPIAQIARVTGLSRPTVLQVAAGVVRPIVDEPLAVAIVDEPDLEHDGDDAVEVLRLHAERLGHDLQRER